MTTSAQQTDVLPDKNEINKLTNTGELHQWNDKLLTVSFLALQIHSAQPSKKTFETREWVRIHSEEEEVFRHKEVKILENLDVRKKELIDQPNMKDLVDIVEADIQDMEMNLFKHLELREKKLKELMNHPNMMKIVGTVRTESHFAVVMEGGESVQSLKKYIAEQSKYATEEEKLLLAQDIVKGLHHLHRHGYVFGGLDLESIYVKKSDRYRAMFLPPRQLTHGALPGDTWTVYTDVYRIGVVLYKLFTDGAALSLPITLPNVKTGIQNLIQLCLKEKPLDRISVIELMKQISPSSPYLSYDVLFHIMSFLEVSNRLTTCTSVSKEWMEAFKLWQLSLDCENWAITDGTVKIMTADDRLENVTSLNLSTNKIGKTGADYIANNKYFSKLTELNLEFNRIGAEGVASIAKGPFMKNLIKLNLSSNSYIGSDGCIAIANSEMLKKLTYLNLEGNNILDNGIQSLVTSENMKNVTWLNLAGNHITMKSMDALSSSSLVKLQVLNLEQNKIGPEGALTLAHKAVFKNSLRELNVSGTNITPMAAKELATCFIKLKKLNLCKNSISQLEEITSRKDLEIILDEITIAEFLKYALPFSRRHVDSTKKPLLGVHIIIYQLNAELHQAPSFTQPEGPVLKSCISLGNRVLEFTSNGKVESVNIEEKYDMFTKMVSCSFEVAALRNNKDIENCLTSLAKVSTRWNKYNEQNCNETHWVIDVMKDMGLWNGDITTLTGVVCSYLTSISKRIRLKLHFTFLTELLDIVKYNLPQAPNTLWKQTLQSLLSCHSMDDRYQIISFSGMEELNSFAQFYASTCVHQDVGKKLLNMLSLMVWQYGLQSGRDSKELIAFLQQLQPSEVDLVHSYQRVTYNVPTLNQLISQ